MTILAGVDIGGTKCAVSVGRTVGHEIQLMGKYSFPTPAAPEIAISQMLTALSELLEQQGISWRDGGGAIVLSAIGISCGGPLDSRTGMILSPPNLPGWDRIDIVTPFQERFGVPTGLQNDANACALAEWKWGAGQGARNLIFLTFGTGMGAGLILDGKLYVGKNDMAGEVGHIRLEQNGPVGYGKSGSFEGFCSGGGIARLARMRAKERLQLGERLSFCASESELEEITTKKVAEAAIAGDLLALSIFETVGRRLGQGLSILIDILNPERIIIGSIYARQQSLLEPYVMEVIDQEALALSRSACTIVPAGLGEQVGDYAGLSVALHSLQGGGGLPSAVLP
ncbi:ROK family protein [Paenibacillus gansuensis]|uniref:ROK family protein n=1 Tax=Paenibacillus gansuensis TaxID=306542 RepID=A0ABW5PCM8_9BACL